MDDDHSAQVATIKRIPAPDEPLPHVALPTLTLFVAALSLWVSSTGLALSGVWPWPISTVVNAAAAFLLFTVSHEAGHNTVARDSRVNDWLGRIAMVFWVVVPMFRTYRFVHAQHHRFTNADDGRDPEHYNMDGPRWSLPLRWLTQDLYYLVWYLPQLRDRPRREKVDFVLAWLFAGALIGALALTGNFLLLIALWLVPSRITLGVLGWSFDYLPHHDLDAHDRYKATRNRVGAEPLLTPLMLYQNYHLVHHLHPLIPFYRYISVWRRREDEYLATEPALVDPRGRPLTPDEYRALRESH
jgi:ring-1,2-phenylacetyl-CoA epoxidase subunit PaaE